MPQRDAAILTYLTDTLWALSEPVLTRLVEIVDRHAGGQKLEAEEIANLLEIHGRGADAKGEEPGPPEDYRLEGSTAIVPIRGVIAKYASQVNHVSQPTGTSVETIQQDISRALEDPKARDILLKIESPGGSLSGIANLAAAIREASVEKTVIAYADDAAASAAYWIGAQAQRFYASGTAAVGSIGIYSVVADTSDQAADDGVKLRIVRSARFKGVGQPGTPVDDADLEDIQGRVDAVHEIFVQEVAAGRGMAVKTVAALADGRIYTAPQAKANGLINGIATLRQTLSFRKPRPRKAEDLPSIAAHAAAHGKDPEMPPTPEAAQAAKDQQDKEMADARAEAATAERARINLLHTALPGEALAEVRQKAIDDGMDLTAAKAAAYDVVQTASAQAIKAKDAQIADAAAKLAAITTGAPDALAAAAPSDADDTPADSAASGDDDGRAETYAAALLAAQEKGKLTRSQAHRLVGPKFPESFKAWNARDGE